jgi:5'(3')-deoxyribonucleotidase
MKPTVLVDVDGVVADFSGHTIKMLRFDFKIPQDVVIDNYNMEQSLLPYGIKPKDLHKIWKKPLFCSSIRLIPRSVDSIYRLSQSFTVVFLTKPMEDHSTWHFERTSWIENNFKGLYEEIIFATNKWRVDGDAFVDDHAENVQAWSAKHPSKASAIINQPWNKNSNITSPRFDSIGKFTDFLLKSTK